MFRLNSKFWIHCYDLQLFTFWWSAAGTGLLFTSLRKRQTTTTAESPALTAITSSCAALFKWKVKHLKSRWMESRGTLGRTTGRWGVGRKQTGGVSAAKPELPEFWPFDPSTLWPFDFLTLWQNMAPVRYGGALQIPHKFISSDRSSSRKQLFSSARISWDTFVRLSIRSSHVKKLNHL